MEGICDMFNEASDEKQVNQNEYKLRGLDFEIDEGQTVRIYEMDSNDITLIG